MVPVSATVPPNTDTFPEPETSVPTEVIVPKRANASVAPLPTLMKPVPGPLPAVKLPNCSVPASISVFA